MRIAWHADDGHDQFGVEYVLESGDAGTRLAQHDEARLGAPRLLWPIMRAGIGRDMAKQLRHLKVLLEG